MNQKTNALLPIFMTHAALVGSDPGPMSPPPKEFRKPEKNKQTKKNRKKNKAARKARKQQRRKK